MRGSEPLCVRVLGMQDAKKVAADERTLALAAADVTAQERLDSAVADARAEEVEAADGRVLARALPALPSWSLAAGKALPGPACMRVGGLALQRLCFAWGEPDQALLPGRCAVEGWLLSCVGVSPSVCACWACRTPRRWPRTSARWRWQPRTSPPRSGWTARWRTRAPRRSRPPTAVCWRARFLPCLPGPWRPAKPCPGLHACVLEAWRCSGCVLRGGSQIRLCCQGAAQWKAGCCRAWE